VVTPGGPGHGRVRAAALLLAADASPEQFRGRGQFALLGAPCSVRVQFEDARFDRSALAERRPVDQVSAILRRFVRFNLTVVF
jgi:hypothetical protein